MTQPSDDNFELVTALSYTPSPAGFSSIQPHLDRLRTAHANLANELRQSWCARIHFPADDQLLQALERAVSGKSGLQRVSVGVDLPKPDPKAGAACDDRQQLTPTCGDRSGWWWILKE